MKFGRNILKSVLTNLPSLLNAKQDNITISNQRAAIIFPPLSRLAQDQKLVQEQHQLIPTKTTAKEESILQEDQALLKELIHSALLPLPSGVPPILLAINVQTPRPPTIQTPTSVNNAPIIPLGQQPLVVVKNSLLNALLARPLIPPLKGVKPQSTANLIRSITQLLVSAIPSVQLDKSECAHLSHHFGILRLFIAKNAANQHLCGIKLLKNVKAALITQLGTQTNKLASQLSSNALLVKPLT
jgi:hypothetical protein